MKTQSHSDFAGFIDGFQARNLAVIQKTITPQVSEMQTRVAIIKNLIKHNQSLASLEPTIATIEESFRSPDDVITRLRRIGDSLIALAIPNSSALAQNSDLKKQIAGLALAFAEAAESSRSDQLIDVATKVAETYESALGAVAV